jgi:hypothetical protein
MSHYAVVSSETGQWTLSIQADPESVLTRIHGPESVIWLSRNEMPGREAVDGWLPEGWETTGDNISERYRFAFPVKRTGTAAE